MGDAPSVLYNVLLDRRHNEQKQACWTIDDVNTFLDALHAHEGDKKEQKKLFMHMMDKCTPLEIKWIVAEVLNPKP
ncbi:hypothetical protein T484DRAFT_1770827 [Baffinella frigidus]|nr:hypothetical protein T484DRAFT_1770827 [Cryptophyta sp. CCMP2293]